MSRVSVHVVSIALALLGLLALDDLTTGREPSHALEWATVAAAAAWLGGLWGARRRRSRGR